MSAEARLAELKLELPPAPKPAHVYKPVVISGNHCYVSGHGPLRPDKTMITGVVGKDLNLEQGQAAARQVGLVVADVARRQDEDDILGDVGGVIANAFEILDGEQ